MIQIENIEIWGFQHSIRGMRNPMNSWDKSDSVFEDYVPDYSMDTAVTVPKLDIGKNDLRLMQSLYAGGTSHRKYLRQIFVSLDITAPLYWWKEFDTYKVGTVANSCSTMHKIHAKEFENDDFSDEHLDTGWLACLDENIIPLLNRARSKFLETNDKRYWWQMIQFLPSSYNQRRTVTMSYENVMNILDQRQGHKLDEWRKLCVILMALPYVSEIRQNVVVSYNER